MVGLVVVMDDLAIPLGRRHLMLNVWTMIQVIVFNRVTLLGKNKNRFTLLLCLVVVMMSMLEYHEIQVVHLKRLPSRSNAMQRLR